jgi:hypothetical protein
MEKQIFNFRLRNAPLPAKVMVAGFLLSLGLAYIYALANIAIVVGLSTKDIAIHYYGSPTKIEKKQVQTGEQTLDLGALDKGPEAVEPIKQQPSLKNLVAEGHFHLFGMTSFFFCLTLLGLFTSINNTFKSIVVGVPFFAVIADNLSFMATRFLGPGFAFLTAVAGGIMGITFTLLWCLIFLEILKPSEIK